MQQWLASGFGFVLNHIEEALGILFKLKGQPDEYLEFDTAALQRSSFKDRVEGGRLAPRAASSPATRPAASSNSSRSRAATSRGCSSRTSRSASPTNNAKNPPEPPAPAPAPVPEPDGNAAASFEADFRQHLTEHLDAA
jgi:hypothetical protein